MTCDTLSQWHTHRERPFKLRRSPHEFFFARWDDSTQKLIATGHGVPPRTTTHWRSRRLPPLGAPATLSRIVLDGQHGVQRLACRVVFISSPPRRHFEYILAFKVCYTPATACALHVVMPPFWPAVAVVLFAASVVRAQYVLTPSTFGSTSGGSSITVTGSWDTVKWTPVVTLQGIVVASTDWVMTSTSLRIKVPAGPGTGGLFLDVSSTCTPASGCDSVVAGSNNSVARLVTNVFSYDPPIVTAVLPASAVFGGVGAAAMSMTIFGNNFGTAAPSVTVSSHRIACGSAVPCF